MKVFRRQLQPLLHGEQLHPRSVLIESHTPQDVMLRLIQYRFNPPAVANDETVTSSAEAMAAGADRRPTTTAAPPTIRRSDEDTMVARAHNDDARHGIRRMRRGS